MKGYYAFWKYDLFPYVLGGPIVSMREDGKVEVEGYGRFFNPFKILPAEAGAKVLKSLKTLEKEYEAAHRSLKDDCMKKRDKIIEVPE